MQSNSKSLNISIAGVTPEFLEVRSFEVDKGRFLSKSDVNSARSYVVIGPDLKDEFFKDKSSSLGKKIRIKDHTCLLYTSPSPRDRTRSRMPSSA